MALFLDKGAHPRSGLVTALENTSDMSLTTLTAEELREGSLKEFDLLLVPGGSAKVESIAMSEKGREEVRQFVKNGGLYIGICAGCYLLTEAKPTDIGLLPLNTKDKKHWSRGKAVLPVSLTPKGEEIFGTTEKVFNILYHNGPVIDASTVTAGADFTPLAHYLGEVVAKGGVPGVMRGSPAIFYGRDGKGWVMGFSPHPEANPDQVFMILNGIRWLYSNKNRPSTVEQKFLLKILI